MRETLVQQPFRYRASGPTHERLRFLAIRELVSCVRTENREAFKGLPDGMRKMAFLVVHATNDAFYTFLHEHGADVDIAGKSGTTPLLRAVRESYTTLAKFILGKSTATVDSTAEGYTPLLYACERGLEEIADLLIKKRASKTGVATDDNFNLLMAASKGGLQSIVADSDMDSYDVNAATTSDGFTALMYASKNGHYDVVSTLLGDRDADPNPTTPNQQHVTALMLAVQNNHEKITGLLLEFKANVDAAGKAGETALMLAAQSNHPTIAAKLLAKEPNVDMADANGDTALIFAADNDHEELVARLLAASANPNKAANSGFTALMGAAENGNEAMTRSLIDAKADVTMRTTTFGNTALTLSCKNGHERIASALIKAGAGVDTATDQGATPLAICCQHGHEQVVSALLSNGADVYAADNSGSTALNTALVMRSKGHKAADVLSLKELELDLQRGLDVITCWTRLLLPRFTHGWRQTLDLNEICKQLPSSRGTPLELPKLQTRSNTTRKPVAYSSFFTELESHINSKGPIPQTSNSDVKQIVVNVVEGTLTFRNEKQSNALKRFKEYVKRFEESVKNQVADEAVERAHGQVSDEVVDELIQRASEQIYADLDMAHASMDAATTQILEDMIKLESATLDARLDQLRQRFGRDLAVFWCPLTLDVIDDPVVASDGFTYERREILKVIETHESPKSPVTRADITKVIHPNNIYRMMLEKYPRESFLQTPQTVRDPGGASNTAPASSS